jgi:hypothetical protein
MASNIAEIDAKVVARIQDTDSRLSLSQRYDAIGNARSEYEATRPRQRSVVIVGTGSFDYAISNLPGFVYGVSTILGLMYPYDAAVARNPLLSVERYALANLPGGVFLRFLDDVPAASQSFLVNYTTTHTLSVSTSTVPEADDDSIADLGAAFCCQMLAAYYSQTSEGTIQADSVNRGGRNELYAKLAKMYRESYERKLGLGDNKPAQAAMAVVDMNPPFSSSTNESLLFRDRR